MLNIDQDLLNKFILHAKQNQNPDQDQDKNDYDKCILISVINNPEVQYGFIYVSEYGEIIDEYDNLGLELMFFRMNMSVINPTLTGLFITTDIGPTKYKKILDREIQLNNIQILGDLLEM